MPHVIVALVLVAAAGASLGLPVLAQKPPTPAATGARFNACTILPRAEVKKIFPWGPEHDRGKEDETPVGGGSVCSYPSVQLYVGPYSASMLESARKKGPLIPVAAIGDEAFLLQGQYSAELFIKVGDRHVGVVADIIDRTLESVKPSMLALAKALVAKLR